jgi:hypothetical protein
MQENVSVCTRAQQEEIRIQNFNRLLDRVATAERLLSEFADVYAEVPLRGSMIAPGYKLWRDYHEWTGCHMILTDHGWENGAEKASYEEMASAEELPLSCYIHDEVNAPEAGTATVAD